MLPLVALQPGVRLGPYEVVSLLGSGGMGEVYRARDTKLNRDVAVKVLPEIVATDLERLARFHREAQVLASLNHPNIAHIYGVEDSSETHALVMELVEGPTLADRIAEGPIPLNEVLPIAKQIAEALEAAHEQGIVHRDLKPANIKVREDGTVKVLDFGLAKLADPISPSSGSATMSPTLSIQATVAGVILGTAAYMSPEQARGKPVDKRADIWAFGVVLFEMLTGARAFDGETISDILARVIEREPDWSRLPASISSGVRALLRQCLKKDPRARLRDAGDARIQIEHLLVASAEYDQGVHGAESLNSHVSSPVQQRPWTTITAALVTGAIAASLLTWVRIKPTPAAAAPAVRFTIVPSVPLPVGNMQLAVSPDGQSLIYAALAAPGGSQLMIHRFDQLDDSSLPGTLNARSPFFSADGKWVGFFSDRELKKVSISGGPATTVCRFTGAPRGASWGADDTIIFATADTSTGLLRVSAAGGEATVLTKPDGASNEADHIYPSILPGNRAVLFTILAKGAPDARQIAVLDLKTGHRKTLIRRGTNPVFIDSGYLVYADAGTLMATAFDTGRLESRGAPVAVVDHVTTVIGNPVFDMSLNGTLAYVPGAVGVAGAETPRSLVWVDRQGHEQATGLPLRTYTYPRLSPDGTKVALDIRDQENDIWVANLSQQTLTRVTFDPGNDFYPVWTPDGRYIFFQSNRGGGGDVYRVPADGNGQVERLTTTDTGPHYPFSMSPDGKVLVYQDTTSQTGADLALLVVESGRGAGTVRTEPLLRSEASESNGEISPDGRWLAYQSSQSGADEVYVRPFPSTVNGLWQVSTGGGSRPLWARNGKELFYLDGNGLLTAVAVQTTGAFASGSPTKILNTRYFSGFGRAGQAVAGRTYDVSHDGKRFLMIKDDVSGDQTTGRRIVLVLNSGTEFQARVWSK